MNLYFGKYIPEIGIKQNLVVLGAEWEQNGKQTHPKSRALSAEIYLPDCFWALHTVAWGHVHVSGPRCVTC